MQRWRHLLGRVARKIWFRAALFSCAGIGLALASRIMAPMMPEAFSVNLGQGSVDNILEILASSMLAVTTFSLTAMVQAYSAAATLGTPRATQLMLADPTSQNALSTFLGGFLFAIVGIVALSAGYYDATGRIILFLGTIVVIGVIALTLLRWISHVTAFGRMHDVIDRVEEAATEAMRGFAIAPTLGGRSARMAPGEAIPVRPDEAGYVVFVDTGKLARLAEGHDLDLYLEALPGTLAHPGRPLLLAEGEVDNPLRDALVGAFSIEQHRTFDQDPRFGLISLAEIASRALSPAVNDPGTAIEILNSTHRVFLALLDPPDVDPPDPLPRIFVSRPTLAELVEAAFRPIARDGAKMVEVQIRLQKTLAALAAVAPDPEPFHAYAEDCAARAFAALDYEGDREALVLVRRDLGVGGVAA